MNALFSILFTCGIGLSTIFTTISFFIKKYKQYAVMIATFEFCLSFLVGIISFFSVIKANQTEFLFTSFAIILGAGGFSITLLLIKKLLQK